MAWFRGGNIENNERFYPLGSKIRRCDCDFLSVADDDPDTAHAKFNRLNDTFAVRLRETQHLLVPTGKIRTPDTISVTISCELDNKGSTSLANPSFKPRRIHRTQLHPGCAETFSGPCARLPHLFETPWILLVGHLLRSTD